MKLQRARKIKKMQILPLNSIEIFYLTMFTICIIGIIYGFIVGDLNTNTINLDMIRGL